MSPLDVDRAVPMTSADEFDDWLDAQGGTDRDVVTGIYKAASGKRTVTLERGCGGLGVRDFRAGG